MIEDQNLTLAKITFKAGIAIICIALIWWAAPFTTIAEYERGVITRFGAVSRTADAGLNFKIPLIENVKTYPINIQALTVNDVQTYTIDNQMLTARIIINYKIPVNGVENIYRNVPDYEARLTSLVVDRFKNALGKLNVVDVTSKRADVTMSIFNTVRDEASRLYGIDIVDLQTANIDYTDEFEKATEQAMTAKAGVERREQEKRQALVEAERTQIEATGKANAQIAAAKGEAESRLAIAKANAEAIRIEGLARAEALKAQGAVVTEELVNMKKAEQWNGQLPAQMLGGTVPFMQIMK